MGLRVAELETLFTADITDTVKKSAKVDATMKALARSDPVVKVGADVTPALAGMDRVQDSSRKLTSADVVTRIDADITKAETRTGKLKTQLEVLESLPTDVTVTADITRAQKALDTTETRLKALQGARAEMVVAADTSKAEAAVGQAKRGLEEVDGATATFKVKADTSRAKADIGGLGGEGSKAGKDAGEGLSKGIIGALVALPIAGTVVGIGVAIGKSLMDGMQVEVRSDALMAKTGLDAKSIAPIARAAGEAYANNFGPSIAENMDTARVAIQGGLLDVDGTAKDSQAVIESLAGVADIIGEEIPAVARATAQILKTGLAVDAQGAFDLIVKGAQAGVNKSEDLLDTFNEYSTQFRKLGLEGPEALGLLSQAIQGGARDSDVAADSLKEFAIRAVDGSTTTIAGFQAIGLNAKEMQAIFVAGGPAAADALGLTLTKLRDMEPGAARSAAAVALFGTQAEDMGDALYAMDLSTAVTQLGNVEGAAKTAIATLGDNTAGVLATAQRNIEVAADGIKGALATAFAPQIKGFAAFVTENRAAVMKFLLDMANGAIDAGRSLANAAADGVEGFGELVGTAGPMMMGFLDSVVSGVATAMVALDPTGILGLKAAAESAVESYNKMQAGALAGFEATKTGSKTAADAIRENLIKNGLDPAQAKLNEVAIPLIAQAALHDASVKLAGDIDGIGYAGNGARLKLDTLNGTVKTNTESGKLLDEQIKAAVASLDAEAKAGSVTGDSQAQLTTRYKEGRQALVDQLVQMGYTIPQAQALADKYNAIPGKKVTDIVLNKDEAAARATALQAQIDAIKQGKVPGLDANSAAGKAKIAALQAQIDNLRDKAITITANYLIQEHRTAFGLADGGTVHAADGRQSMIAPGGANILWAEPETGWETYISGKPSQRARNIGLLKETARRFGLTVLPAAETTQYAAGSPPAATPAPSVAGTPWGQLFGDVYLQAPVDVDMLMSRAGFALSTGVLGG